METFHSFILSDDGNGEMNEDGYVSCLYKRDGVTFKKLVQYDKLVENGIIEQNPEFTKEIDEVTSYNPNESNCNKNSSDEFIWTKKLVNELIQLRIDMDGMFQRPKVKKINIWAKIATIINSTFSVKVTAEKCDIKWRNLWQTYKFNVKKSNSTGRDAIIWEYFDIINEKFGTKANVNPPPSTIVGTSHISENTMHIDNDLSSSIIGTSNISENNVQTENDLTSTIIGTPHNNANNAEVLTNKKKKFKSCHDSFMQDFINLKKVEMVKLEEKQKKIIRCKKTRSRGLAINGTSTC
uniref:Myb/SANT-like DNA-binding domain-containing protein n=1 Tax=Schizaphis graminum TaxID=13262 RepID=A0A2S2PQ66_SCHGA